MKKQIKVLEAKPNNLETFNSLMLLGHTLYERNGKEYSVKINWKEDKVELYQDK